MPTGKILFVFFMFFSCTSVMASNDACTFYDKNSKSNPNSVKAYFDDKDNTDGVAAIEVCDANKSNSSIYIISDFIVKHKVKMFYADRMYRGGFGGVYAESTLPIKGRVDSFPDVYMCLDDSNCSNYSANGFVSSTNITPASFYKIKSHLIAALSSRSLFDSIFDRAVFSTSYENVGQDKARSVAISEIRDAFSGGKYNGRMLFSLSQGDLWTFPAYEIKIFPVSGRGWRILFDLDGDSIVASQVDELVL